MRGSPESNHIHPGEVTNKMTIAPAQSNVASEYPARWDWKTDGPTVDGVYVETTEGHTVHGARAVLVVKIGDTPRSIWVNEVPLQMRLRDELRRRRAADFDAGERIVITRGTEKRETSNGYMAWPFRVKFPDQPKRAALDIIGGGDEPDAEPELPADTPDDSIPF
jgi:hypothetical protein